MKVGFIGLGKLGLPVALSIENKGHEVVGFDTNPAVSTYLKIGEIPYKEEGTPELLQNTKIKFLQLPEVIANSDIVFCPVQTPHDPRYEGISRLPEERVDFDYTFLKKAVKDICEEAKKQEKHITLIVISTVLPGTVDRELKQYFNEYVHFCYNPFFIAMGTTRADFENPEFVLLGCDDELEVIDTVKDFYSTIHNKPVFSTSVRNAELIKVIYNTYISSKIAFINTVMEICHKMNADVDAVSDALSLATERIISPKYLRGGMGDGGGCHPRDNIALSWLAQKLDLSYDYFEHIMLAREKQTEWLASLIEEEISKSPLPVVIMGISFKKETNLTVGSPAILLERMLDEKGIPYMEYDPHVLDRVKPAFKGIYFIGTNHDDFKTFNFPRGSVVLDPWGYIPDQDGVKVIRIGRNESIHTNPNSQK